MIQSIKRLSALARIRSVVAVVLALGLLVNAAWSAPVAMANVPGLDRIKVTLFIAARGSVPAVTLQGSEPLVLSHGGGQSQDAWMTVQSPVKVMLDQFYVQVLETTDYAAAEAMRNRVLSQRADAMIWRHARAGKTLYRVVAGFSSNADQARQALADVRGLNGAAPVLAGPLHWQTGSFAALSEAEQHAAVIAQAGIDAEVAMKRGDNGVVYTVFVGNAAAAADLTAIREQAAKLMPNIQLQQADAQSAYLLRRMDVTAGSGNAIPSYAINADNQRLRISAAQGGTIQVDERFGRSYRGAIEISQYANQLAVINDVPFEQYLASVVGTEMGAGFPLEALKAQAVAARTFALLVGMKYGIAHISDTTFDQAYTGVGAESAIVSQAVQATQGEVLLDQSGKVIEPFYSSNAGGFTAHPSEVWLNPVPYVKQVPSPDENAQAGKHMWDRVILPDGQVGFIRTDYTTDSGSSTEGGFPYVTVTGSGVNVRPAPKVDNVSSAPIAQVNQGDRLIRIDQVMESGAYSWMHGPFAADELLRIIQTRTNSAIQGPLTALEVTKRGPSGRAIEVQANGQTIAVSYPDQYRNALGGLNSTRFEIEQTADLTILGSSGKVTKKPENAGSMYVLTGTGSAAAPLNQESFLLVNADAEARVATVKPHFVFIGSGFGHGLGMSQWGAKDLAENGYGYRDILQYYYQHVNIAKG
ncbi:hypothetical protein XYCOK13_29650 [Xylanibacillus composti]|uniref:SPOR domain-containing protein n=1 Tax=Xylanibacillus composti TaxID=1572762 RepID=A0A8J4H5X4_9BACL|nr:SpoIID/LytB domain-containing protein [Xylanibacillus composti]GIQ70141.1 hypothetical protein XYCOK13_29650 [Xylanibacillus composti]